MIVTVLSENTPISPEIKSEHGLSIHVKTKRESILFDTGASSIFIENAEKLGIDISSVDKVILSHGHYDHGGGLDPFLEVNKKALVYLNKFAFGNYYSVKEGKEKYIGLDKKLLPQERFVFIVGDAKIDDELEIFSGVRQKILSPSCNSSLFMREEGDDKSRTDAFRHEQDLIIREEGNTVLLSGCAHSGIVNILEHYVEKYGELPTHVIGGFHLYSHSSGKSEDPITVFEIGRYLLDSAAEYYTGHCTGDEAYNILKRTMGQMLHKISAGSVFEVI
ncbi:MAG: MBL fold metallo-hydrolase [Synergistota bacterium]|nr:MBL fold metallo-hydrolase [Synergistota bacterium]